MNFKLLADSEDAIPTIARWYFDEWGHLDEGSSVEKFRYKLGKALNRDRVPLVVLAVESDVIIGVTELKFREMDIYPEKEHWLGGVFVPSEHRGRGIASSIVSKASEIAKSFGIATLYLQTERLSGGLYACLGWRGLERVSYKGREVLVMERRFGI
jgi:GNAT superfamily N-acetyltransferase